MKLLTQQYRIQTFGSPVPVIPSDYERKDHVTKLLYLAARPSLALRTLYVLIPFFARLTDPPSREGGRWETKHFIGMAQLMNGITQDTVD